MTTRQRWLVKGTLLMMLALFLGAGVYVLATFPPTNNPFFPKCMSYTLLNLHCPGCGLTRATHALLNGQFTQSLAYNLTTIPVLLFIGLTGFRAVWSWLWGIELKLWSLPNKVVWLLIGLFMLYGVLRNIPYEPFKWLAPHEINAPPP